MRISIFGLGYVGAVTAACLAENGHDVIAMDTDAVKVKCLQSGLSPIVEPGLAELIAKHVAAGRLRATLSCEEAIESSDLSLICVGTPSHENGALNLKFVEAVCADIGLALKKKQAWHVVVLRSTVVPGTARSVAIPILEDMSGKTAGIDFGFGNNPEFLRESTAIDDYFHPPKIVIGALDKKTAATISALYEGLSAPRAQVEIDIAESVKYADNAWHAMKVGFANELGNILQTHGVDSHKVMDVFCLDTKLNISKAYLVPGFAFGGSCLPKDVRALRASAKAKGLDTPVFDSLLTANAAQVAKAYRMIVKTGKQKIGFLGLAFKAGTDDLRESPLLTLAEMLIKNGFELMIYDPSVYRAAHMQGTTQKYIREHIPYISQYLVAHAKVLIAEAEVLVIGNRGADYAGILAQAHEDVHVIDLVRLNHQRVEKYKNYQGICW